MDCRSERVARAQVVLLRITADEQCQLNVGHGLEDLRVPSGCEASTWRKVAVWPLSGVVEVHREQGEARRVAEGRLIDAEPLDEATPAGVVPGDARPLCLATGSLSHDHYSRGRVGDIYRLVVHVGSPGVLGIGDDLGSNAFKAGRRCRHILFLLPGTGVRTLR